MARWIDLSAHGMRLLLVELPNAKVLALQNGDANPDAAVALGFSKRPNGSWIRTTGIDINPREFLRFLPKAAVKEMPIEEFLIRQQKQTDQEAIVQDATAMERPESFIGLNKVGQEVHEIDGRRCVIDAKNRKTFENAVSMPTPGLFLRAVDDGSLVACAEGFIKQYFAKGYDKPDLERFCAVISTPASRISEHRFRKVVSDVAMRSVLKKGDATLRDRFGKAIEVLHILKDLGIDASRAPLAVVVRRLMGSNQELLGSMVSIVDDDFGILGELLPRGSKATKNIAEATITVDLAGGKASEVIARLKDRRDLVRSFAIVDDEADLAELARQFHIEAACRLSKDNGGPAILVSFGSRIGNNDAGTLPSLDDAPTYGDLWTWATEVAIRRSKAIAAMKSGLSTDVDLAAADPSLTRNDYQVPYSSGSRVAQPTTMVPKDLDGPARQALNRAISLYGDLDQKVAIEFGIPRDKLGDVLAPEQIDALALCVHAEDRGREAFLIADGAGVGKGRTVTALASRSAMQGRRVILLTEREINLSDLMRDWKHLGFSDRIRVGVINDGAKLIDEDTGQPFTVADAQVMKEAIEAGEWPSGVDVVIGTYSQFNRAPEESARVRWLHAIAERDSNNFDLILDESHNAVGESRTAENIASAIDAARFVVFSSATFAANPEQMASYERLFPKSISADEIVAMMRKGGEPFQEAVSSMLVADGVMVRREQDLSKISFSQVTDEARLERNREYADRLAEIITELAALSGEIDSWIDQNRRGWLRKVSVNRMGLGTPLYRIQRLFSAALLAEFTAERAVEALKAGKKPVILVDNTLQAVLEDAAAKGTVPTFKSVLHRILNQVVRVRYVDANGNEAEINAANDRHISETLAMIAAKVDELPDLPASAIDEVRMRIEEAGFSCGEITGRSHEIRNGRVVPRRDRDAVRIKNDFNSGKLDAVIINTAGATGIDLHAGERFADQRPRVLQVLQGPAYVFREIQALFRIFRRGQTSNPEVEFHSTGLPAEVRLAAIRNRKLSRLTANTSANRDSAFLARNIPDILNPIGDTVISRYAEMRPDLLRKLHLVSESDGTTFLDKMNASNGFDDEPKSETEYSANIFLSRLNFLPCEAAQRVLDEVTSEYEAHVAELEAKGENPLRSQELQGIVHIHRSSIFERGEGDDSVFDGPLYLTEASIERVVDPITSDQVVEAVEIGSAAYPRVLAAADAIVRNRDMYLTHMLPSSVRSIDDALANESSRIARMAKEIAILSQALKQLAPGRSIPHPFEDDGSRAIITSIQAPPPGLEHLTFLYKVDLAIPGETEIKTVRLGSLLKPPVVAKVNPDGTLAMNVMPGLEGSDYDKILDGFDDAKRRKLTDAKILTGNMVRAVLLATKHNLGSVVSFVDANGVSQRGVLVNRRMMYRLHNLEVRFNGERAIIAALSETNAKLESSPGNKKRSVSITRNGSNWTVNLPPPVERRGTILWPSEAYQALYEQGAIDGKGRSTFQITSEADMRNVIEILSEAGIDSFYADSKFRSLLEEQSEPVARRVA